MKSRRKLLGVRITPSFVVALLALVVALGGTATAAGLVTSGDIKKNAVKSKHIKNATIKVKDLSPAAIAALKGNAGAPGISGYETVSHTVTVEGFNGAANGYGSAVVQCPAGKKVLGGGIEVGSPYNSNPNFREEVKFSGPRNVVRVNNIATDGGPPTANSPANGWMVAVKNTDDADQVLVTAWAICANVS